MSIKNHLIVASDLSETSYQMLDCLGGLSRMGFTQITLVHCIDTDEVEEEDCSRHTRLARTSLSQQAEILVRMGFQVEVQVPCGVPQFEILRIAGELEADMLVVGSSARTLQGEVMMGSITTSLIYSAPIPVLVFRMKSTVPPQCHNLLYHIMYPTDFSKVAAKAFRYLEAAVKGGAQRILLVHIQEKARIEAQKGKSLEEFNAIDQRRLEELKGELIATGGNPQIDIEIPFGSAKLEILKRVKDDDFSLMIIGTQGRGFIADILLGSVSHYVAQKAPVPVLFIPAS